jgi:hypothetical protein
VIPYRLGELRVPARFVARAYVDQFANGALRVTDWPTDKAPKPEGFTVLMCDGGVFHYFHFMEAMIWLWTVQHAFLGGARPARIVFDMPWDNAGQNYVQRGVLAALYPGVPIGDPGWNWPASFENALIYDRSWAETRLNKIVEGALGVGRPHVMNMSRHARRAVGAFDGRTGSPRILYVTRPPPRCFAPDAEHALLTCLQAYGQVTRLDFAALPWDQQVRIVAAHDVLVGVHGNGLTNALWMRPGSLVLEFFSPGARHYDYQFFAELAGLAYFGFDGPDKIFPAFSRTGEPYGHGADNNTEVTHIPITAVRRLLDTWMPPGSGQART